MAKEGDVHPNPISARNPVNDLLDYLTAPNWTAGALWLLLFASVVIAVVAWRRDLEARTGYALFRWPLRLLIGLMWREGSLWKIPPNEDGLLYWMKLMVDHAVFPIQGALVRDYVIPNIDVFGPIVYLVEVGIGVSMILGLFTRLGALAGIAMAVNLWLGLYSAPGEWPWTYGFLIIIMAEFFLDPPGRQLGLDALLRGRRSGGALDLIT
jgi:uncharacterized membrane protein YphA (DoxX/SURF4 family)